MNKLKLTLILPALAVLALSLSSCSGTFWIALGFGSGSPDVSGKVVDARGSGTSFLGATVTLQNVTSGDSYRATVDGSGNWAVDSIKAGNYVASVSYSGNYFFTKTTTQFSYSGTGSITAPTLAGINTASLWNSAYGYSYIAFILMWNNTQPLNLYLTAPDGSYPPSPGTVTPPTLDMSDPNFGPSYATANTTFLTYWSNGFGPNGAINSSTGTLSPLGRVSMPTSATVPTAFPSGNVSYYSSASSGYGPDTITLMNMPTVNGNGFAITPNSYNLVPAGNAYWQGVAMLYIDAPAPYYISTAGSTTNATLWAVQANPDGSPDLLGIYTVPTDTPVATLEALRINILDNDFQIVPQMAAVSPEAFRSATGQSGSGVFSVARGPSSK